MGTVTCCQKEIKNINLKCKNFKINQFFVLYNKLNISKV